VQDRLIQQALLQQPYFDVTFSDWSFGCRPGRGAHGQCAVLVSTFVLAIKGWSMWIWSNSPIASTATC
jgi:hypothetical protein